MRTTISKQETNQLPNQVVARFIPITELLNDFRQLGDKAHYNELTKELCLAFTGNERGSRATYGEISTLVFNVNFIKKILNNLELASVTNDLDAFTSSILEMLPEIDIKTTIEVLDDSLTNWISLTDWDVWNPEYLETGLTTFNSLNDLFNRLMALSLIFANKEKGGASC